MYSVATIVCPVKGSGKFCGIVSIDNRIYFTPYNEEYVLVLDSLDASTWTMELPNDSEMGSYKWTGLTVYTEKLFTSPFQSHCILVVDTKTDTTYGINCGEMTDEGCYWSGIIIMGKKILCSPQNALLMLIIDGDTESRRKISCNDRSDAKWFDITALGMIDYSTPFASKTMLNINIENEIILTIDVKSSGRTEWQGLTTAINHKIVCAPHNTEELLMIEDVKVLLLMWRLVSLSSG